MTQHTPGPLFVVFNEVKKGYNGYRVETAAGYIVAEIVEKEPDARLIAKAPEMLVALTNLVRRADNGDIIEPNWYEMECARALLREIDNA